MCKYINNRLYIDNCYIYIFPNVFNFRSKFHTHIKDCICWLLIIAFVDFH